MTTAEQTTTQIQDPSRPTERTRPNDHVDQASKKATESLYRDVQDHRDTHGNNYTSTVADSTVASNNQSGVMTGRQAMELANSRPDLVNPQDPSSLQGGDRAAFIAANRNNPAVLDAAGILSES